MIFETIAWQFYNTITNLIQFQIAPLEGIAAIYQYIDIMLSSGLDIFKYFMPPAARVILLIIIAARVFADLYFLIMWVIKKIPFLSMS